MTTLRLVIVACAGALLAAAAPAFAQREQSRCADCHFARAEAPGARHVSEWDGSAHADAQVGCEKCHGGDPTTFEPFLAHKDILRSSNPASPVNRMNVATTCGQCHAGPFVAFQRSKHYELLRSGNRDVPACMTCHTEVGTFMLSPKALQARCASCHGSDRIAPRSDFAPEGRMLLDQIRDARGLLKEARGFIRRIKDTGRRARLEEAAQQAEVPLVEAVNAGHAFVFDNLKERLEAAQHRIGQLYEDLANPATR